MTRLAGALLLIVIVLCSCAGNTPSVSTLPADVALTTGANYDAETSALAIPPGGRCGDGTLLPNGRIVVASGGATLDGGGAQRLLLRDLNGGGSTKTMSLFDKNVFPIEDGSTPGADNVLLRLRNGDLLLIWAGATWKEMTGPDGKHPAWWDTTSPAGSRGAFHIWRSTDCGTSWTYDNTIDSAKVKVADAGLDPATDMGRCGWPQGRPNDDQKYSVGGWDREEAYVDPFDGKVYLSTDCDSGNAVSVDFKCFSNGVVLDCKFVDSPRFPDQEFYRSVVLAADENGKNWSDRTIATLGRSAPIPLTSTQSGLFAHQCTGDQPTLYRRLPPPNDSTFDSVVASSLVTAKNLKDCWSVPGDGLPADDPEKTTTFLVGNPLVLLEHRAMSRVYRDPKSGMQIVRIAYPAIEGFKEKDGQMTGGRQVLMVTIVRVKNDGTMVPMFTHAIRAKDPKGSVLQATSVETDRTDLGSDSHEDAALLYWIEEVPGTIPGGKLIARGQVVRDSDHWSNVIDLSNEWTPAFKQDGWRGDYLHGAYFFADGKSHFLAQWPQTDETLVSNGAVTPNLNIHYNVVTVDPASSAAETSAAPKFPPLQKLPVTKPGKIVGERLPHELERPAEMRARAHTHPPASMSSVVTAPQASASEFFFGAGRCAASQTTIYAGVVPDDASRVELHYMLRDAHGRETTSEVVKPMARPGSDRHVYARAIRATEEDLPGYARFAEGRLLYYVAVTDSRGVTTRGETYGEQSGSEIRVARCGR
jgi:hypothetical protein